MENNACEYLMDHDIYSYESEENLPFDKELFDHQLRLVADYMENNEIPYFDMRHKDFCIIGVANSLGLTYLDKVEMTRENVNIFAWLTFASWFSIDNTVQGAIKRIRYYLENGAPNNALEQVLEECPYIFA